MRNKKFKKSKYKEIGCYIYRRYNMNENIKK